MPVDPDCDDGDCGDEPPDPGEECAIEDCATNGCAVYDSTALGGERRSNAGGTFGYWIHRPYAESASQTVWNTKYFTHVASDWEEDTSGADTLTYAGTHSIGTGFTRSGEGGYCTSDCNQIPVQLFDGSYAPSSAYSTSLDSDPPVLLVQWRVITLDGVCTFQARKFGPFADGAAYAAFYSENSAFMGPAATYQDAYIGMEDEGTLAFNETYPWSEYEEVVPYPIYCSYVVGLPEEWFSGGVTGFDVILGCYSYMPGPEPYNGATGEPETTSFAVAFGGGKPTFFPSSITFSGNTTTGEQQSGQAIGRSVVLTAPAYPDGWPPTSVFTPCQRKIEYRATIGKTMISASAGFSSPYGLPFFSAGNGTITESGGYVESECQFNLLDAALGPQGCQNSYFSGTNEDCNSVGMFWANASFAGDPTVPPVRNSADSVTWTGIWTVYYENNVDYTTSYSNTDNDPANGYISSKTQDLQYRNGSVTISRTSCNTARTADVGITLSGGQIAGIAVNDGGRCYSSPPAITISGGGGMGATAYCTVNNGSIESVIITNPGSGYTSDPAVSPFTVNGLSVAVPVLKPAPCLPEECEGFKATWMGKPKGPKSKNGDYEVEWFLIDDCPGMCTSNPPEQPKRVTKTIMVEVYCRCPE